MKIKLSEIVNSVEGLKSLQEVKLPIKISYKISKLINGQIERELKNYDQLRNKLVKEYGEQQKDDSVRVTDPKKLKEFAVKLGELLDLEIELDFEPIAISDLGDIQLEAKSIINWLFI